MAMEKKSLVSKKAAPPTKSKSAKSKVDTSQARLLAKLLLPMKIHSRSLSILQSGGEQSSSLAAILLRLLPVRVPRVLATAVR